MTRDFPFIVIMYDEILIRADGAGSNVPESYRFISI
jgi:hypothetical protein